MPDRVFSAEDTGIGRLPKPATEVQCPCLQPFTNRHSLFTAFRTGSGEAAPDAEAGGQEEYTDRSAEVTPPERAAAKAERATVRLATVEEVNPEAIRYLNRLSDLFFVMARWVNAQSGTAETEWSG